MTLLIKNVKVLVGGTRFVESSQGSHVDVFVSGDKISAIGNFPNKKADTLIDGQECYLSPGFIDVHTTSDHHVGFFHEPGQADFLKQGITTMIGGWEGASLAPLLYGSLESLEWWSDPHRFNVDWHTLSELRAHLERSPLGVNFGTFVGYETVRRAITGPLASPRALTKNEEAVFGKVVARALDEGAFGLSVDDSMFSLERRPPHELLHALSPMRKRQALYAVSLARSGAGLARAFEETAKLLKKVPVAAIVSCTAPPGEAEGYEELVQIVSKLVPQLNLRIEVAPYSAAAFPISRYLPKWAQSGLPAKALASAGDLERMGAHLDDERMREKVQQDLPDIDPVQLTIMKAPHHDSLVGMTLKDFMKMRAVRDAKEALLELMRLTRLHSLLFEKKNGASGELGALLAHPRSLIGSRGYVTHPDHRTRVLRPAELTSAFTAYRALAAHKDVSLEAAIAKVTRAPARLLNLEGRGEIREGNFADLVGFKGDKVKFVVVNGVVAVSDDEYTGSRAGRPLKHRPPASQSRKQQPMH